MNITITQFQAILIENSLNFYRSYIKELNMNNDKLLSSSKEWKEYDSLFDKLADLSDTSRDEDFYKQSALNRNGKDLDSL